MTDKMDRRDKEIAKLTEMLLKSKDVVAPQNSGDNISEKLDEILRRLGAVEEAMKAQHALLEVKNVKIHAGEVGIDIQGMTDFEILSTRLGVDKEWYLKKYPDIKRSGVDPVEHYLNHGAEEGRNPRPDFMTTDYCLAHPELNRQNENPLVHYIKNQFKG